MHGHLHNATLWDSWWILIKQLHEIYGQSLQLNFMRSLVNFHNSTSWDRWWILIFLSQKNIRESLINFINFLSQNFSRVCFQVFHQFSNKGFITQLFQSFRGPWLCWGYHKTQREVFEEKDSRVKMTIFVYFGLYLAMSKDFGQGLGLNQNLYNVPEM